MSIAVLLAELNAHTNSKLQQYAPIRNIPRVTLRNNKGGALFFTAVYT
jgi:hypothetical protein